VLKNERRKGVVKMDKKILASMVVIGILALAMGYGTYSYFNDTETSTGNTFTAGTLDLKVNGTDDPIQAFNISNLKPGDIAWPAETYVLTNNGSIAGNVTFCITGIEFLENGLTEPEKDFGDNTEDKGELQDFLWLHIRVEWSGWGGSHHIYDGFANGIPEGVDLIKNGAYPSNIVLNPGESVTITISYRFRDNANHVLNAENLAQSDSISMDLVFGLVQA
jgi:predicted ribosomally synthesized peptide with SipW-like signal peptide